MVMFAVELVNYNDDGGGDGDVLLCCSQPDSWCLR